MAAALTAIPAEAKMAPIIVTTRHPYLLTSILAMGPHPRVMPTRMEGMKETEPEPSLKAFLSSTT